jgi:hypothetical protein
MKKMDIFPFVAGSISLLAIILVLTEPSQQVNQAPVLAPNNHEEIGLETKEVKFVDEDQRRIAYDVGYKKGYNNFMKTSVDTEDKVTTEYTSNVEDQSKIDLESEEVQEIMMKGYVDGYHKAGESLHCPRNHY